MLYLVDSLVTPLLFLEDPDKNILTRKKRFSCVVIDAVDSVSAGELIGGITVKDNNP
jgi:hypothetical protein